MISVPVTRQMTVEGIFNLQVLTLRHDPSCKSHHDENSGYLMIHWRWVSGFWFPREPQLKCTEVELPSSFNCHCKRMLVATTEIFTSVTDFASSLLHKTLPLSTIFPASRWSEQATFGTIKHYKTNGLQPKPPL